MWVTLLFCNSEWYVECCLVCVHQLTVGLSGTTESHVGVAGDKSDGSVEDKNEAYNRKRRIVLKIVVPVLLSVAAILTLSAFIVGLSACLCERNRRYVKVK